MLGLIGESGAGKSTLGLAAMGFYPRRRADLERLGGFRRDRSAQGVDGQEARPAGQAYRLCGAVGSRDVQPGAQDHRPAYRRPDAALRSCRGPRAKRTRWSFTPSCVCPIPKISASAIRIRSSGGQLQRAMTAMAMSCRPDLIIFDEPTTALDVTTQIEVLASIRNIVEQFDTAAIYITHDLAVVAQMADRIKVLLRGDEVETADTRDDAEPPQEGIHQEPLGGARLRAARQTGGAYRGRRRSCRSRGSPRPMAQVECCTMSASTSMPGAPSPSWANPGRASPPPRAASPGCCRRREGVIEFDGVATAAGLPQAHQGRSCEQAQMIYQMADTALNPRKTIGEIIGRPVAVLHGPERAREARSGSMSCWSRSSCQPTQYYRPPARRSCRAGRSSGSASPARWPRSRSSSSATR